MYGNDSDDSGKENIVEAVAEIHEATRGSGTQIRLRTTPRKGTKKRGKIKAMEKWNPLITKLEALGYIKTSNVELKTECADLKAVNKELRAGTKDLIDKQAQIKAQLEEMVGITRSFSADPGRQQVGLYGCTLQY